MIFKKKKHVIFILYGIVWVFDYEILPEYTHQSFSNHFHFCLFQFHHTSSFYFFFYHLNSTIWYLVFGNKLLFRLFYYLIPEINQFFSIIPMKKRNGRSRSWRHGQTEFGIEIVLKHMKKFRIRKHSNLLKYCIIEDLR